VVVRMTVDEDGRVTDAEAVAPSRWPLLNSAAVRAIRTTWRFRKGPARIYEVSIEFVVNRHD
jgi:TonB family protein